MRDLYIRAYKKPPNQDPVANSLEAIRTWTLGVGGTFNSLLYPGSYIHVAPALVFPRCVFVDSFKPRDGHAAHFFGAAGELRDYLAANALTAPGALNADSPADIAFYGGDYNRAATMASEREGSFDMLLSLSAPGNISVQCAKWVRKGGLLVANDDHGDASMAMGSPATWTLVGAVLDKARPDVVAHNEASLTDLFVDNKGVRADQAAIRANAGHSLSRRPHKWAVNAFLYIFRNL